MYETGFKSCLSKTLFIVGSGVPSIYYDTIINGFFAFTNIILKVICFVKKLQRGHAQFPNMLMYKQNIKFEQKKTNIAHK